MTEQFSVADRTVLVTGAGGGIGSSIANAFRQGGANVLATDANLENLRDILTRLPHGNGILPMAMDVAREEDVARVLDEIARLFGRLDVLINNAGIKSAQPLLSGNADKIERTIQINSVAVLRCSKLVIERFMNSKGGRIVNVGSSLSSQGAVFNYQAGGADYCLSKAIVHDVTKLLAYECAPLNINVNAIAPGIIDTPMHGRPREETEARHSGRIPLGRVGLPEDIAGLAVFLASPAASYMTGQIVHVNGGMLMNG
ncbi:SDR family oxidoreductase [Bradyrhizobium sp. IC3069]|uniref:3-oxoacyl-[acyl-carrier protein] reductase n=1 Tax=Bradyrhizobium yuanmingense TaxID=108015 RepID=A0ABV4GMZ5_9BRAD|nr:MULTISPECIES: SDR family oxidoreductase [Bradyrhizobium]MCA1360990.1 SDR family oxidoreductase [Bradyrhizobium sp. IC4059]MCA1378747.1 SDR family oxidoreductase [Bradyrhizobium sp. IC4060]MCA1411402.1 SDR family oxidoreductase [Bradyrhizobium sp. NBAIM20]MCA1460737.1 SDR family oxidoreductase [Bradyrhizobium sp. NBAIM18]MCA1487803.1 SDR family oxidoreductase [Bradyrhizobium sp. IC4061]